MIQLETKTAAMYSQLIVTLQSIGDTPSIGMTVRDAWKKIAEGAAKDDDFDQEIDPSKRKQVVTYITPDGPAELVGAVPESQAINLNGQVYRVVLDVGMKVNKKTGLARLAISGVREVWESSSVMIWPQRKAPISGKPALALDEGGRILKVS